MIFFLKIIDSRPNLLIKNDIYTSIQWQVQKAMAILKIKNNFMSSQPFDKKSHLYKYNTQK